MVCMIASIWKSYSCRSSLLRYKASLYMCFLSAKKPESSFNHVGRKTHSSFNTDRHISSRPKQVTLTSYKSTTKKPSTSTLKKMVCVCETGNSQKQVTSPSTAVSGPPLPQGSAANLSRGARYQLCPA
ncbi:hypothetical protein PILCRDRAFT_715446 [Piloderma croceum F 1598]|uniref:Uncharacterized protein n=1 Tax=Piloderma croceum (strain F 1598) TaxID=765440 RepID=A0A0C3F1Y5_PILCF|nr:hypothetical protein PILCRDRAFT_715446 [Piloderma croceum F 1598]